MTISPKARLIALSLALFLLLALPACSATQRRVTVPKVFYGVSPQVQQSQSEYKRMKRNGVDSVRFGIPWIAVEPSPGNYDFSSIDTYVGRIARAGMEPFPFVGTTPDFYGVNCQGGNCFTNLPAQSDAQLNAWKALLQAIVRRYGSTGTFWAQNPGIPKHPIRVVQPWNEENFSFFTDKRSPALYGKLVKASHEAVRSVDPHVDIVLGGLFAHPKASQGVPATRFLNQLYAVPGIKGSFEGVALHPYAKNASELKPDINEIRSVMKRHGDASTGFYLTEMGWGSGHGTRFEKGPKGQVNQLTQAFNVIRSMQRSAHIQRVIWFAWDDLRGTCNFCDSVGLVRQNGNAKPSLARYQAFALNRR